MLLVNNKTPQPAGMAPLKRAAVKRYVQETTGMKMANDSADLLVSLDYQLFMKDLMMEAERLSEIDGSHEILATHIRRARDFVLKKYQG